MFSCESATLRGLVQGGVEEGGGGPERRWAELRGAGGRLPPRRAPMRKGRVLQGRASAGESTAGGGGAHQHADHHARELTTLHEDCRAVVDEWPIGVRVPLARDEEDVAQSDAEDGRFRHGHGVLRTEPQHERVQRHKQPAATNAGGDRERRDDPAEQRGDGDAPGLNVVGREERLVQPIVVTGQSPPHLRHRARAGIAQPRHPASFSRGFVSGSTTTPVRLTEFLARYGG